MPGREDFWNVGYPIFGIFVYALIIIAPLAVFFAFYSRYRIWLLGRPMPDLGPWGDRIKRTLKLASADILGHRRFVKREEGSHGCAPRGVLPLTRPNRIP